MEGHIDLCIQVQDETIIFKVIDTGIGIAPEKLSAVFQPFFQTDFDFNRRYEGAGLGLSISKAYVELLGGEIWIESDPEIGSTVCFSIPIIRNEQ
jgi:signal transduction histidine kinase